MEWDEELKRQAAISALLAPPEADLAPTVFDTESAQSVGENQPEPDVVKFKDIHDYHKLIDQTFDTESKQSVGDKKPEPDLTYPTIAEDQGQPDKKPLEPITAESVVSPPEEQRPPSMAPGLGTVGGAPATPPLEPLTAESIHGVGDLAQELPPGHIDLGVPGHEELGPPPAPDKLTQVERAKLVKLPVQPAPDTTTDSEGRVIDDSGNLISGPPRVERGQLVSTPPDTTPKALGAHTELAPPGQMDLRPDQLLTKKTDTTQLPSGTLDQTKKTDVTKLPVGPITSQTQAFPTSAKDYDSLIDSLWPSAKPQTAATTPTAATERVMSGGTSLKGTDDRITEIVSNAARALPEGYTIRATSGMRTAGQGQHTLGKAQDWQIYDPKGNPIVNRGDDTTGLYTKLAQAAYGYQEKYHPELTGQFQWGGQFGTSTANNPNEPDLMHFDIGGRRGRISRYSRESIGAVLPPESGAVTSAPGAPGAPSAPEEPPINTLVKLDQSGLNVTHFGYNNDPYLDRESAKGHGKFVKDMIPGYDVGLNDAALAIVGNPKPGETFQFAGREWRYADRGASWLSGARFDIYDKPGTALNGQYALGKSIQTAQAEAPKEEDWRKGFKMLSSEEQTAVDKQITTRETGILDKINQASKNPGEVWKALQVQVPGVSDTRRQAYADNFKQEVTKYAQDFYGEKDPEKAFTRAISDPGLEAYVSNVGRGLAGAVGQADIGIAQAGKSIDNNRVDGFAKLVHPESTGEGRAGFIKTLTDIQDVHHRHDVFNEIYGNLDQNTKDAIGDPASILDSIDHLASPQYRADLNKGIAVKRAWVDQQLQGDPSLRGTAAGWWTTGTGENIFNTVAALVPGGIGAVVRTSTLGAQIYSSNTDRIAQEHPDWSSDKVSDEAAKSAFMTLAPQEAVMALSHGIAAPLLKWVGAAAEKPIVRFGIGGGIQVAAGATGGALGKVGENIAENKDPLKDVGEAAKTGAIQSLPFAVHGGVEGVQRGPVEPVVSATRPPVELPPERLKQEHGLENAPEPTEPSTLRPGQPVRTSDILGQEQRAVTTSDVLGPDVAPSAPTPRPWYMQGVGPTEDPLVIRGAERSTFTPGELSDIVQRLPANATPEELRGVVSQMQSPTSWHLGDEGNVELEQTRQMRAQAPPVTLEQAIRKAKADAVQAELTGQTPPKPAAAAPQRTSEKPFVPSNQYQEVPDHLAVPPGGEYKVNMATGKTEARWTEEVPGPEKVIDKRTGKPQGGSAAESAPPPRVSESEPFTSKIANRYTAERMATGELGHIDPSQGKSTEELVMQGMKMPPDQRERLINNFSRGTGGDLDSQGAAIRSKEAILSAQSSEAGKAAEANPANQQLKAQADAALKAVTDFHNGPVKKFKRVWSDAGRGLQRDIPLDYSTLNGIKEAYTKGFGKGKEAPPEMEPTLKQTVARVRKATNNEEAAVKNAGDEIGKEVAKKTRGKTLLTNDQIRTQLMEIMKDLPCRN